MNIKQESKKLAKDAIKPRSGLETFKDEGKEIVRPIKEVYEGPWKKIVSGEKRDEELQKFLKEKGPVSDKERFELVNSYYGNTPESLKKISENINKSFKLNVCVFIFFVLFVALFGGGGIWLLPFDIIFSCYLFMRAARDSFHLYQIRNKTLSSFKEWVDIKLGSFIKKILGCAIIGSLMMPISGAQAQDSSGQQISNLGNVVNTFSGTNSQWIQKDYDLGLSWLQQLFPGALPEGYAQQGNKEGSDIMGPLFRITNGILCAVASGLMFYQLCIGLISTAREGEVLGKEWTTSVSATRVVIGVGSLAPLGKYGYCLIQLIAVQLILGGYGIANAVFQNYSNSIANDNISISTNLDLPHQDNITQELLRSEVCWSVLQQENNILQAAKKGDGGDDLSFFKNHSFNEMIPRESEIFKPSSGTNPAMLYYGPCGSMTFPVANGVQSHYLDLQSDLVGWNSPNSNNSSEVNDQVQNLYQAFHKSDLPKSVAYMHVPVANHIQNGDFNSEKAQQVFENTYKNYYQGLLRQEDQYYDAITQNLQKHFNNFDGSKNITSSIKNMADKLGWAAAGAINPILLEQSSKINKNMINSTPKWVGPTATQEITDPHVRDDVNKAMDDIERISGNDKQALARDQIQDNTGDKGVGLSDANTQESQRGTLITDLNNRINQASEGYSYNPQTRKTSDGDISWIGHLGYLVKKLDGVFISKDGLFTLDPTNPMKSMQNHGWWLLTTGSSILGSAMFAGYGPKSNTSLISEVTKSGADLVTGGMSTHMANVISGVTYYSIFLAWGMLLLGIILVYIIPMLPYILWIWAVFGCIAFAGEMVMAAPMAAFMHVRLDGGNDLVGNAQRPFYTMLFNGIMRPTLCLYGFFLYEKALSIMSVLLDSTYSVAASAVQIDMGFAIAILGWFINMLIFVYLQYQIVIKSMSLVNKVPAAIERMIGVNSSFEDPNQQTIRDTQFLGGVVRTRGAEIPRAAGKILGGGNRGR